MFKLFLRIKSLKPVAEKPGQMRHPEMPARARAPTLAERELGASELGASELGMPHREGPHSPNTAVTEPPPPREGVHDMTSNHHVTCTELCHAMRMDASQCSALSFFYSSLFRKKWSRIQIQRHRGEEYFAFWGFVSSAHIRNKLLALISYVFKTRIVIAANTKQGMFECVCAIENTAAGALRAQYEHGCGKSTPESTELFLLWFLELFNMSADVIRFDSMLNPLMLASIDRLEHARSPLYGNLTSPALSDFYELYKCKRALRDDNATAQILTGHDLSVDALCRLRQMLSHSQDRNQKLARTLRRTQELGDAREHQVRYLGSVRHVEMQEFTNSKAALGIAARLMSSALPSITDIDARTEIERALAIFATPSAYETAARNIDTRAELRAWATPSEIAAFRALATPSEIADDARRDFLLQDVPRQEVPRQEAETPPHAAVLAARPEDGLQDSPGGPQDCPGLEERTRGPMRE